jgi:hypothetical protein
MNGLLCAALAVLVVLLGGAGIWIGLRHDNMQAKIGGAVVIVVGLLGLVSCLLTH